MNAARCLWGDAHGARLNAGGGSIPSGISSRGFCDTAKEASAYAPPSIGESSPASDEEAEIAQWGLLDRDPHLELRLMARTDQPSLDRAPNAQVPRSQIASLLRQLPRDATLAAILNTGSLRLAFPLAIENVLEDPDTQRVIRDEPYLDGNLRAALARAVMAETMLLADSHVGGTFPIDGGTRDAIVERMIDRLGGSDRGLRRTFARTGLGLALGLGVSRPLERRRAAITNAVSPAAGDVALYLARGERIRAFIHETVRAIDDSVVLVGHSLGGVASLELLGTHSLPSVEMLITVGSQAPYLYELNALPTLEYGTLLPKSVPPWVNVFDRRDLLAFVVAPIFDQVEDIEVNNRSPFPRAHSAYFANPIFYELLARIVP